MCCSSRHWRLPQVDTGVRHRNTSIQCTRRGCTKRDKRGFLASQAHVQILVAGENVSEKHLQSVSGEFSTEQGLASLPLADSGLSPRYVGDRSIALVTAADSRASPQDVKEGKTATLPWTFAWLKWFLRNEPTISCGKGAPAPGRGRHPAKAELTVDHRYRPEAH